MTNRRKIDAVMAICALLALLMTAGQALALQERHPPWPPENPVEVQSDVYWETMSNRYISISLGTRGWIRPWPKDWQGSQYDVTGRWSIITNEGNPETPNDNDTQLIFMGGLGLLPDPPRREALMWPCPCGNFGYFKVKIGDTVYVIGDTATGAWSKRPIVYQTPASGMGAGRVGGYIDAQWAIPNASAPTARINIRLSLVRDQMRFEITLINSATTTQSMGFGINGDVTVDYAELRAYPYIVGRGYSTQTATALNPLGTLLSGTNVPDMLEVMDSVENPVVVARNTLRLHDCVPPDHVAVGEWWDMNAGNTWLPTGFNPDPLKPVSDLNWLLCWNPVALGPGGSKKIVTYYGVGAATAAWNYRVGRAMEQDSCCLAVQGPRSLKYDSTTLGMNDLSPNPFEIKAYLYNMATDPGPYNLDDVTMSLYLPPGLTLAMGETAKKSIGRVPVSSESDPVTWLVEPTGEYSGELEYFVTARDISGWQQVVSRKIVVPATKKSVFRSGYQLMNVPFTFNDPSLQHALGLSAGSFGAMTYDPVTGQYVPASRLYPGQSFWIYVTTVARGSTLPFQLAQDAAIIGEDSGRQTREQYITLKRGWNLIGNPFVYPMYWGQVLVASTSDPVISTVSLDQAVTNGWLSKTVFSYVPESGTYEHFKDNDRLLIPWRGYWVKANMPITLVMRPPVPPASDVTALPGGY